MQECHQRKQEILGCEQLMENMCFYGPGVFPGTRFPPIVRTRAPLGGSLFWAVRSGAVFWASCSVLKLPSDAQYCAHACC